MCRLKVLAVYLVTEIDVTNPEAYGKEFAPKAQATIKAAGGRLVAIGGAGGAGAKPVLAIEGQHQNVSLFRVGTALNN